MRRAAVWLALASLLALSAGQPFHPGTTFTPRDGTPFTVSSAAVDAASLPHGDTHRPGRCSICRAIGQVRLGVHGPTIEMADPLDAPHLPFPLVSQQTPSCTPGLASIAPRAPPGALPLLNS